MNELIRIKSEILEHSTLKKQYEIEWTKIITNFLYGRGRNTYNSYFSDIKFLMNNFILALDIEHPSKITKEQISHYVETLESHYRDNDSEYPTRTFLRKRSSLKSFFRWLYENSYTNYNLSDHLPKRSRGLSTETYGLSEEEIIMLTKELDNIKPDIVGLRNRAHLLCALYIGSRNQDVAKIRFSDLFLSRKHPFLRVGNKGSNGERKKKAINPHLKLALADYLSLYKEIYGTFDEKDYIFRPLKSPIINGKDYNTNKPLSSQYSNILFKRFCKKAQIVDEEGNLPSNLSFHTARKSIAIHLYRVHGDIKLVKDEIGWKSIAMCEAYTDEVDSIENSSLAKVDFSREVSLEW